jgi:hypothetical protein
MQQRADLTHDRARQPYRTPDRETNRSAHRNPDGFTYPNHPASHTDTDY